MYIYIYIYIYAGRTYKSWQKFKNLLLNTSFTHAHRGFSVLFKFKVLFHCLVLLVCKISEYWTKAINFNGPSWRKQASCRNCGFSL